MTNFEHTVKLMKRAKRMARETTDENLKKFYENAGRGFEIKLGRMTIEWAEREVE